MRRGAAAGEDGRDLADAEAAEGASHPVPERLRRRGSQQTGVDANGAGDAVAGRLVGERDVGDDAGMGQERRKAQAAEFLDRTQRRRRVHPVAMVEVERGVDADEHGDDRKEAKVFRKLVASPRARRPDMCAQKRAERPVADYCGRPCRGDAQHVRRGQGDDPYASLREHPYSASEGS